jgi:flagellar protein FlbD
MVGYVVLPLEYSSATSGEPRARPRNNFKKGLKLVIQLTRLNHAAVVVNSDLIEHIEMNPDTVISMTTGLRITVLESTEEIIRRVVEFRRLLLQAPELRVVDGRDEN